MKPTAEPDFLKSPLPPVFTRRVELSVLAVLFTGSAYQIGQQLLSLGAVFSWRAQRWWLVLGLYALGAVMALLLALSFTPRGKRALQSGAVLGLDALPHKGVGRAVLLILPILYPLLTLYWVSDLLADVFPRLLLFALFVLLYGGALRVVFSDLSGRAAIVVAALLLAFVYQLIVLSLPVTDYPFSLSWSETSRYYYASLFFSPKLYGVRLPYSVLHPTRYLLQSFPFVLDGVPLWGHRLWQVLLWLLLTGGAALALARRLRLGHFWLTLLLAAWGFLFLMQGPVYYHLAVPLILVLLWFDSRRFWRSLLVVVLASAWAGVSRVNWYPVPGALAVLLYILETPMKGRSWWEYLLQPFSWGSAGLAAAFVAQALYVLWSHNEPSQFASSFFSDLLWYRLWPNSVYPLGLVLNTVLVSLPPGWILFSRLRAGRLNPLRVVVILGVLLIFLAGGLVVSVKIGGGSNLHNMDAYLALLLVVAVVLFFGRQQPEEGEISPDRWAWPQALAALAVPLFFTLQGGARPVLPSAQVTAASLDSLRRVVQYAARNGGDVLFISQRHLLLFDDVLQLPLVPEYEKVFFMEMVMARNPAYLDGFYHALEEQRFAAIVSDRVVTRYKDRDEPWSEEHNLWVQYVSRPLLCYYRSRLVLQQVQTEVLYPRPDANRCPAIEENRVALGLQTP